MPGGGSGVRTEMIMWIKDAEDKLIQLAEATPDNKYAFRPSKEVRTTGEVFMHVSAANFGVPSFWGVKPPESINFATHEKAFTKKAEIVQSLKDSFAYMEKAFMDLPDADLDKPAEFFGMKTTVRGGYMLLLSHAHEHLGQSIAYARMNGIVPPWTAKDMADAKARKDAEKKTSASK
jgi:uncharacterized damage-inducible protein DinB